MFQIIVCGEITLNIHEQQKVVAKSAVPLKLISSSSSGWSWNIVESFAHDFSSFHLQLILTFCTGHEIDAKVHIYMKRTMNIIIL